VKTPDVLFYVCANCVPEAGKIPRQWKQGDVRVKVQQLPCTGKVDTQYMMHAIEGGARGVSIVACPEGECHLAQGNYRADVRIKTTQRILEEIGMEKERISLLHYNRDNGEDSLDKAMRDEVDTLSRTGKSPLQLRISAN
jgi:F420-non-reducing hydrogenase iron-sulfur subunit